jgi:hypothetical protein
MSLRLRGRIKQGRIELAEGIALPDGTDVLVSVEVFDEPSPTDESWNSDDMASWPVFGMWADRPEMEDSAAWVRRQREAWQQRLRRRD